MKTEAEQDAMHDAVVKRFPGGLSPQQFRLVTLESADDNDDGLVYPPWIAGAPGNPMIRQSMLIRMLMDDLLARWNDGSGRPIMHQPSRYKITEKGREWLRNNQQPRENRIYAGMHGDEG